MEALSGYTLLYRSILNWEWHDSPNTLSVFVHLLSLARYMPGEYHGIEVARGQVITGRKSLAEMTGLSEQEVRTALRRLQSTGEITIRSTNKYSLITVVNYDVYQPVPGKTNQQINHNGNQERTSTQPACDHNGINENKGSKDTINGTEETSDEGDKDWMEGGELV